ncbi:helix-turn-helix domain-containing protein [Nocardioides lianchengensis]|uniref:AraC-type DNA-binding protein n=1 Tax=Nocardioides lianchengensis TaxID=1045774 RepID=A0A1G7B6K7_9ACTN|nr:AraC family transcriptional regulator [Nocardioides lianchengensis]NYG10123.1 AraC-like DNA-binding protein [Nocardioides lianchengensis]SDE21926.1 AraC-type DNA-binding protein [Nocardioides lianchengensis]
MAVPRALAPYVSSLTTYDVDLGGPGVHRGLPSTSLTFVLPVDAPLQVSWVGRSQTRTSGWSSVSGLHTEAAEIHHDGTQRGVQLALTTAGARALLGVGAAELSGELLDLTEVSPCLRHLPEQLAEEPDEQRWAALVGRELTAALARHGESRPRAAVGRALAGLTRGARVQDVAAEVGYSRRHLATLVRAECGLTPKELQRVGRFERSRRLVGTTPLGEVAVRCGYADQAHLTREWVALAGCPPSTWLREEFPFLQDSGVDDGAG